MNEIHVLTHTSRFVGSEFIALVTGTKVAALGVSTLAISAAVSIFSTFINIYVKEMTSDKKLAVWPVSISRYYAKRFNRVNFFLNIYFSIIFTCIRHVMNHKIII